MSRFTIMKDSFTKVKRYNMQGHKIEFKINPVPNNVEPTAWIKGAVEDIFEYAASSLLPSDKIGITFCGKSFEERGAGWINFKNASDLKFNDIWEMISKIFQSNSEGLSTDTFCVRITSVKLPQGKGKNRRNKYNTFDEECAMRKGIVSINNGDNLCLPRALVVAIASVEKDSDYVKVRKDTGKLQTQRAQKLINDAQITIPSEGAGITELRKFQEYLQNYKIVVYQYGNKGNDVIFEGNSCGKSLNLLYNMGHYNVITSLTAAFCCSYYCEICHVPYNTKTAHRCSSTCPCCQQSPPCNKTSRNIICKECNRSFRGQLCYNNHIVKKSSAKNTVCEYVKKCAECLKIYKADKIHMCGEQFCKICVKHVPVDHLCFIQQDRRKPKLDDTLYIFYDLETRQEKVVGQKVLNENIIGDIKDHEPNLCVFQQRCHYCIAFDDSIKSCSKCGIRRHILDKNPVMLFIEFVLNQRKLFKNVVVIAHNGQAFDHQFILNYILLNSDLKPELIMRGTKIILMQINNVKFIDSLNYFPMALSKLTKAFDLPSTVKKGYFPHLFNTKENENYIGQLPSPEFYGPDTMKSEERDVFFRWYNEHKNDEFNMRRDIVEYCISDVQILTEACLKFRKILLDESNVEPFLETITIASACNLVFRRNFLKPDTIGIIPKTGYRFADNQSREAIQWLIWEEDKRKIDIQHAAKGREAVIAGAKVDGYCQEHNLAFEYYGCYYHGHPACLQHNRDKSLYDDPSDTLNQRYERTEAKARRLRSLGYEVIEMWACDFQKQINEDEDMEYLKSHPLLHTVPLDPRDAFYGGRTGNSYNYYKCKQGEIIKYIDVCSLYPWVCKYGKFPLRHPRVIVKNNELSNLDLSKINGLIKCRILPPEDLLHPVLPVKQHNKLMFPLCRTCSEYKCQEEFCPHSDEERALTGTWIIDEVLKAVEKGYQILQIFEVWDYVVAQYNKVTNSEGLFTEMMNRFIKMKQQASGWPNKCVSEQEKEKYIKDFFENEDVTLEYADITNNSGLRSLAKLMLNSFWGKFGQRENQQKTCIVNAPSELYELLTNPAIDVCHILPVNEETIVVSWQYKEEAADGLSTANVCVAAYTTAQARLKLYYYLERIGNRVLYYDTDSVIFVSREGEYNPLTGEFIGDMTDELECFGPGSYITEFVSGGPKNYAYKVYCTNDNTERVVCKVKGICLNYATSQQVNFESIKEMVLNMDKTEEIHVLSHNIRRTQDHKTVTVPEIKRYRLQAEKRRFLDDHSSLPYGYKRLRAS